MKKRTSKITIRNYHPQIIITFQVHNRDPEKHLLFFILFDPPIKLQNLENQFTNFYQIDRQDNMSQTQK